MAFAKHIMSGSNPEVVRVYKKDCYRASKTHDSMRDLKSARGFES
jgi:hypothetical protein